MNIDKLIGDERPLTPQEAYFAMYLFLESQNKMCSNEMMVNDVLSIGAILADGGTVDPAIWHDWLEAVEKARNDKNWDAAGFTLTT